MDAEKRLRLIGEIANRMYDEMRNSPEHGETARIINMFCELALWLDRDIRMNRPRFKDAEEHVGNVVDHL